MSGEATGRPDGGRPDERTPASGGRLPSVDVVICAYTMDREALLRRAIASAAGQGEAERVIVVVDYCPELLAALTAGAGPGRGVTVCANTGERGLSGARNTGLSVSQADVIAFLDDDAFAAPGWLAAIRAAHADPRVLGTGGWVEAEWEDGRAPGWLPDEFLWTVGCSYRGLPLTPYAQIRNPIGANMSFRRELLASVGGFRSGLGRIGTMPLGCEETEAAILVRAAAPGGWIVHLPDARVAHFVPRGRGSWAYFRSRCLAEGYSKASVAEHVGSAEGLASERRYVAVVLPGGVVRGAAAALGGDPDGLRRAAAIVAGLGLTAAGYLRGRAGAAAGCLRGPLALAGAAAVGAVVGWVLRRSRGSR